jgi:putative transposase
VRGIFGQLLKLRVTLPIVISDSLRLCAAALLSQTALAAENLFLRKQLGLFRERDKKAAATSAGDRFVFSKLDGFFDWRSALVIVKPATLIG